MNILFTILFDAWCMPYDPEKVPHYLQNNPVKAYGLYTFQRGVKLGMELASSCLDPEDLAKEV